MITGRPRAELRRKQIARASYPVSPHGTACSVSFRDVLEWLIPPPQSREALEKLFDYRAEYEAIRSWRYGRAAAPQWALEILDKKLAARVAILEAQRAALRAS